MPKKCKLRTVSKIQDLGLSIEELHHIAIESIKLFLSDKSYFCGGPIPKNLLYSTDSIMTVLGTKIDDEYEQYFVEKIYPNMAYEKNKVFPYDIWSNSSVPCEIAYDLHLINHLRKRGIPKTYQWGLMLLYYKFCHGLEIPPSPKCINL